MSNKTNSDQPVGAPKNEDESTAIKGQNSLFVRIDQNSNDNLQELFDSILNPGDSKRPLQVPFRMRKLPNSFFNPPASSTSKPTSISHSRVNSADSAFDAGSQSSIDKSAAPNVADKISSPPTQAPTQSQLLSNGLPICHSRAHSSPATLQQTYKLHGNNEETTNQESGGGGGGGAFPVLTLNFSSGNNNTQKCGGVKQQQQQLNAATNQQPTTVFHGKQRSYDVISPIQLQNEYGALPPGWEQAKTNDGQIYYLNHITKTTQWEDPRIQIKNQNQLGLQIGPRDAAGMIQQTPIYVKTNARGDIHKEAMTVTDNLGPLPEGWEQALTESGDIYFINHNNRTTSWNDPRIPNFLQKSIKAAAAAGVKNEMSWMNSKPSFEKDQEMFAKQQKSSEPQNSLVRPNVNLPMDPFLAGDNHVRQESGDSGLSLSSNTFSIDFIPQIDDSMDGLSDSGNITMTGIECPDNLVSSLQLGDDLCNEMFTDVHSILNSGGKPDNLDWYKIN